MRVCPTAFNSSLPDAIKMLARSGPFSRAVEMNESLPKQIELTYQFTEIKRTRRKAEHITPAANNVAP